MDTPVVVMKLSKLLLFGGAPIVRRVGLPHVSDGESVPTDIPFWYPVMVPGNPETVSNRCVHTLTDRTVPVTLLLAAPVAENPGVPAERYIPTMDEAEGLPKPSRLASMDAELIRAHTDRV